MSTYRIYKETALPGTLQPHSIYLVAPAARPDFVEMYVTGASAATVKRVIDQTQVQSMIDASLSGVGGLTVVNDIAARNALSLTTNTMVFVVDASADATVNSGGATYVWRQSNSTWVKISEAESMDLNLTWTAITGRPTSTPAQIDSAVTDSHTHANKTELDKVGEDVSGRFTYSDSLPVIGWTSTGW